MREARPSCSGGMVIQSSRRGLDVNIVESSSLGAVGWLVVIDAAAAPPAGGNEGPKSSSPLLLSSSSCLVSSAGSVGLSSKGAGGMAGPATFLRFSEASSGLAERCCFAPEAVPGAFSDSSSCCRFRLARRWGGRAAPMPDIVLRCWWYCVAFRVCLGGAIVWMELWVLERACCA